MLRNAGNKVQGMFDTVGLIQDRTQILFNLFSDSTVRQISYAQIKEDGGIKFVAYLESSTNKLLCSSVTMSAYKVSLADWSESAIFENSSMTQQADNKYTLDKTRVDVGFDMDGEFVILVNVIFIRNSKQYLHKYYVSDIGIYEYADFLRRKIVFTNVIKKDGP